MARDSMSIVLLWFEGKSNEIVTCSAFVNWVLC